VFLRTRSSRAHGALGAGARTSFDDHASAIESAKPEFFAEQLGVMRSRGAICACRAATKSNPLRSAIEEYLIAFPPGRMAPSRRCLRTRRARARRLSDNRRPRPSGFRRQRRVPDGMLRLAAAGSYFGHTEEDTQRLRRSSADWRRCPCPAGRGMRFYIPIFYPAGVFCFTAAGSSPWILCTSAAAQHRGNLDGHGAWLVWRLASEARTRT